MASVLLGLCEDKVSSRSSTTWKDNKFGGMPDWYLSTSCAPNCSLCGNRLLFLCQLYSPISNSPYHRTLYIFTCCNTVCRNKDGSWMVLRFQSLPKSEPRKASSYDSNSDFWGVDEASWSDEDEFNGESTNGSVESEFIGSEPKTTEDTESLNDVSDHESKSIRRENMQLASAEETVEICSIASAEETVEIYSIASAEETVEKMTCLSLMDVDNQEPDPISRNNEASVELVTDKKESQVLLADDFSINPNDSILSKILVNTRSNTESVSDKEACPDVTQLESYFINAYNEQDFVVDMKHCRALEHRYLKEDSELRSFFYESKESVNGLSKKEKNKKSTKLNIERHGVEEYDKKSEHIDRAVVKFSEKVKLCPQQVIRYSYNGTPLHFNEQATCKVIPRCDCGSPRIFEMQLMPAMVDYLRLSPTSDSILEFGSVYVYTCAKNCWIDDAVEPHREFIFSVDYTDNSIFKV